MAKLTKTEQRAFDALNEAPGRTLGIEALAEAVYGSRARPAAPLAKMAQVMRLVILKTERERPRAIRTTGLGRGKKAEYQIVP